LQELILKFLQKQKRKRIKTTQIEKYIQQVTGNKGYQNQGGYEQFAAYLKKLVKKGEIKPIKAWGRNGLVPEVYNGYQLTSTRKLKPEIKKEILTEYHPRINTTYYLKNISDYEQDKKHLKKLRIKCDKL